MLTVPKTKNPIKTNPLDRQPGYCYVCGVGCDFPKLGSFCFITPDCKGAFIKPVENITTKETNK
jgi:hypothetical protein